MLNTFYSSEVMLRRRDILDLKFSIEYPLHIGERQEGITKKILYFKVDGKEIPIIPAESFKGVLRHLATKIAKKLFEGDEELGIIVKCHDKDTHVSSEDCLKYFSVDEAVNWLKNTSLFPTEKVKRDLSSNQIIDIYLSFKCPICRLFGSKNLASKLVFYDVVFNVMPEVGRYTSTSISRKTRTVEEERLFQIEYIPPDDRYELSTKVVVDNVEPGSSEAILLANTLEYIINYGLPMGGAKSRGFGLLKLKRSSKAIILKLKTKVNSKEDIVNNISALLLRNNAISTMSMEEYHKYLKKRNHEIKIRSLK